MSGADVQAAMAEYTVERREAIANDYATEIWSDLDGTTQITRDKVIEEISRLNQNNAEKIYPRPEQVINILTQLEIVVLETVEGVSTAVEAACEDLNLSLPKRRHSGRFYGQRSRPRRSRNLLGGPDFKATGN
jgi:hypothetical protein